MATQTIVYFFIYVPHPPDESVVSIVFSTSNDNWSLLMFVESFQALLSNQFGDFGCYIKGITT